MTRRHLADPLTHPRDGRAAFWMNESDYLHAQALAEAAGEEVTAVYHSHVDVGAYLSELDLEYAEHALFPFPGRRPDRDRRARTARGGPRPLPARGRDEAVHGTRRRVGRAVSGRRLFASLAALVARGLQRGGRPGRRASGGADRGRLSHARGLAASRRGARGAGAGEAAGSPAPAPAGGGGRAGQGRRELPEVGDDAGAAEQRSPRRFPGGSRCSTRARGRSRRWRPPGARRCPHAWSADRSRLLFTALVDEFAQLFELDVARARCARSRTAPRCTRPAATVRTAATC